MADQLVEILDRRIREILESAYQRASHLAAAYKAETGMEHPLVSGRPVNGRAPGKTTAKPAGTRSSRNGRIRRTPDQLRKEADEIVALIKRAGKTGVSGEEIRKEFPKVGQLIQPFVEKWSDHKLRKTGKSRATKWFVRE
jgi:hypothetical protein